MMYNNKLAVALKSAGKVLREFKDAVYITYGAEYSILIKNLNTVRASVNVTIDGTDVTENLSLIVGANGEMDLTRFIKNGNLEAGNRFKFIERTGDIENHRGIGIDDGLIRVEFEFEREPTYIPPSVLRDLTGGDKWYGGGYPISKGASGGLVGSSATGMLMNFTASSCAADANEVGITVPGSISSQKFSTTYGFNGTGVKQVMVLRLLGETTNGAQVAAPVTVKSKPKCISCGRVNKNTSKYCTNCGTSLELL
jgi:hypothetical protein